MNLKFAPTKSHIDLSFWVRLAEVKIDHVKLDESEILITGYILNDENSLMLEGRSFDDVDPTCPKSFNGYLILTNTFEKFTNYDKKRLLHDYGNKVLENFKQAIKNEKSLPIKQLSTFYVLCYADIKKYKYYYWFAVPSFNFIGQYKPSADIIDKNIIIPQNLLKDIEKSELNSIPQSFFTTDSSNTIKQFSVDFIHQNLLTQVLNNQKIILIVYFDPFGMVSNGSFYPSWVLRNLLAYLKIIFDDFFRNLSTNSSNRLHNNIKFCIYPMHLNNAHQNSCNSALAFNYMYENDKDYTVSQEWVKFTGYEKFVSDTAHNQSLGPKCLDHTPLLDPWLIAKTSSQLNIRLMKWRILPDLDLERLWATRCLLIGAGTLGCNVARCLLAWGITHITFIDNGTVSYSNPTRQSLYTFEDAFRCAQSSSTNQNTNVKSPDLNLTTTENNHYNLLRNKAEIAAQALKTIYPNVVSKGYNVTIPCPGHAYEPKYIYSMDSSQNSTIALPKSKEQLNEIELLDALIQENDAIFLLTDSRESRWLPTVIGAVRKKLVITTALGFDSYLIIRHGLRSYAPMNGDKTPDTKQLSQSGDAYVKDSIAQGYQLGCYFCNDIIAPTNSQRDRSLDQQCTVTRPGLSFIASGLAVELCVSILQHPLGINAPCIANANPTLINNVQQKSVHNNNLDLIESLESPLGLVPHQLRGFISNFSGIHPLTLRFDKCIACSEKILDSYAKDFAKLSESPKNIETYNALTFLPNVFRAESNITADFDPYMSSNNFDDGNSQQVNPKSNFLETLAGLTELMENVNTTLGENILDTFSLSSTDDEN